MQTGADPFQIAPRRLATNYPSGNQTGPSMPFQPEERDRLIALAQNYAEAAVDQIRLTIEDTGSSVLVRGLCLDANGREQVETLSLSWELVERSGTPEHFLKTQIWAVERGVTPAGSVARDRP